MTAAPPLGSPPHTWHPGRPWERRRRRRGRPPHMGSTPPTKSAPVMGQAPSKGTVPPMGCPPPMGGVRCAAPCVLRHGEHRLSAAVSDRNARAEPQKLRGATPCARWAGPAALAKESAAMRASMTEAEASAATRSCVPRGGGGGQRSPQAYVFPTTRTGGCGERSLPQQTLAFCGGGGSSTGGFRQPTATVGRRAPPRSSPYHAAGESVLQPSAWARPGPSAIWRSMSQILSAGLRLREQLRAHFKSQRNFVRNS